MNIEKNIPFFLPAVQHERKPILDKKDFSCNTSSSFASNSYSKIFIRKDLNDFPGGHVSTASAMQPCDLGVPMLGNNRLGATGATVDMLYHMSPSQQSMEDDISLDSVMTGCGGAGRESENRDLSDILTVAREKYVISKALDMMSRVQCLSNVDGITGNSETDKFYELDGPLLLDQHMVFNLQTPEPVPPYLNIHYVCESGSRLLFLSVHWAKSIPAFQLLPLDTQTCLLRGCWAELFMLGLAQCSQTLPLSTVLFSLITQLQTSISQRKLPAVKVKQVTEHIRQIQDFTVQMSKLHVDEHEYAYLKAITLFSGDQPGLVSRKQVEKFQEKSFQGLRSYINQICPDDVDRFPR